MVTDTNHHATPVAVTTPTIATPPEALAALAALRARVVGLMAWKVTGHDDLRTVAEATSARVAPEAWGTGAERPSNCPVGRCCVVAEDPDTSQPELQPAPVAGSCALVFRSDRYDTNLGQMIAQAVVAIARGAPFSIGAQLRDAAGDDVDTRAFVERLEAVTGADCDGGGAARDTDGDGVPDTLVGAIAGARVCFRVTVRPNTTVPARDDTRAYPATLQLTGDGLAAFTAEQLRFVVAGTCPAPSPSPR